MSVARGSIPGDSLAFLPANRAVTLDNVSCPYCGSLLPETKSTVEHVIGRRFVPKGTMNACWNLILGACERCNARKADLEDDISAITMAPDMSGRFAEDEAQLRGEAQRKGRGSLSRRTRKPVIQSTERFRFTAPFLRGRLNAEFVAPPQVDMERLHELARLQLMGFFYFLTYQKEQRRGWFWKTGFHPLEHVVRADWGNPVVMAFTNAIGDWEPRLMVASAEGYYRALIRRHPNAECWAWALEWNRNYRLVGFFGDREAAEAVVSTFPKLELITLHEAPNSYIRVRHDVALRDEDDKLFAIPDAVHTESDTNS
jgi:hypothetical protein